MNVASMLITNIFSTDCYTMQTSYHNYALISGSEPVQGYSGDIGA